MRAFKAISDAKKTSFHLSMKQGLFIFLIQNILPEDKDFYPGKDESEVREQVYYSHSLKLALYGVNLGLFARFIGGFDRLFLLRLWSLRKNGIKLVSLIPPGKHGFSTLSIIP